jgi:hypothetical protein
MRPTAGKRAIAMVGAAVGVAMILMKVTPALPGHFSGYEWAALLAWICLGVALKTPRSAGGKATASQ